MTDEEHKRAETLAARARELEDAWHAAVLERDEYLRALYGGTGPDGAYRADVVDLFRATGIGRTMLHRIVKGARPVDA